MTYYIKQTRKEGIELFVVIIARGKTLLASSTFMSEAGCITWANLTKIKIK